VSYDRAKIGILAGKDGWALLGETTVSPDTWVSVRISSTQLSCQG